MYSAYKIQLIVLFSVIFFLYTIMVIQYNIWKFSTNTDPKESIRRSRKIHKDMQLSTTVNKTSHIPKIHIKTQENVTKQPGRSKKDKKVYKALQWQKHDGMGLYTNPFESCKYTNCKVTNNETQLQSSDVILITMRFLMEDGTLPNYRLPSQRWVMLNMESPIHKDLPMETYDGIFNATATYREESDIYVPYGEVKHRVTPLQQSHYNYAKNKTKLAAIFLSHCNSQSKREDYIRKLMKYIPIDVYGSCGSLSCPRDQTKQCEQMIEKKYKFYLAFENSLCQEYVTEKLWSTMKMNVVPVVMGMANYSSILPPHSYIDVRDFKTVSDLAEFLKLLDKHNDLYNAYFLWKRYYDVFDWHMGTRFACSLCEYMNRSDGNTKTYHSISAFWNKNKQCLSLDQFYKNYKMKISSIHSESKEINSQL